MRCDLPTYKTMHRRLYTELSSVLVEHTAKLLTICRVVPGNAASHALNPSSTIQFDEADLMSPDFLMRKLLSTKLLNEVTFIMRATATWCCSAMCAGGNSCTGIQDPQRTLPSNWGEIRTGGPTNGAPPPPTPIWRTDSPRTQVQQTPVQGPLLSLMEEQHIQPITCTQHISPTFRSCR